MSARRDLAMAMRLAELHDARRSAAEAAMMDARLAEARASRSETEARTQCRAAEEDWSRYLARPGFSPDFSAGLSAVLVEREAAAAAAGRQKALAAQLHNRRLVEWREAEARARSGEKALAVLRRRLAKKKEEKATAAAADLVTYGWFRQ